MKKNFYSELPEIIKLLGYHVSRKTLHEYCIPNQIQIPSVLYSHNRAKDDKGHVIRGMFDLRGMLANADTMIAGHGMQLAPPEPEPEMTDDEVEDAINSRFASLDLMTYGVVDGNFRSMIVSGNPGIGKTYNLEYILEGAAAEGKIQFDSVRGFVRATGLYKLLWEHREKKQVLMLDDADSVFQDEIALNLLKGALDTTKKRTISWRSEKVFEAEDGEMIPSYFDFNGSVIFVSNINFQRASASQNRLAPHLEALMSRSFYLDLNMTNVRELMCRIRSVVAGSDILTSMTVKKSDQKRIVSYIETNAHRLREMSLRTVIKLGTIMVASGGDESNFKKMADATTLVRGK